MYFVFLLSSNSLDLCIGCPRSGTSSVNGFVFHSEISLTFTKDVPGQGRPMYKYQVKTDTYTVKLIFKTSPMEIKVAAPIYIGCPRSGTSYVNQSGSFDLHMRSFKYDVDLVLVCFNLVLLHKTSQTWDILCKGPGNFKIKQTRFT